MKIELLLSLIIIHCIVDFFLQNDSTIKKKSRLCLKVHILHAVLHGIFSYLILGFFISWKEWIFPVSIFISHFFIDLGKCLILQKIKTFRILIFLLDQFIHLSLIIILWDFFYFKGLSFFYLLNVFISKKILLIFLFFLLLLKPTSILISFFLEKFNTDADYIQNSETGIEQAGEFLGYLERIFIYIFILTSHFQAIGFLLAAKSVFRFKDQPYRSTEYIMIGTFLSFLVAIIFGLSVAKLIS